MSFCTEIRKGANSVNKLKKYTIPFVVFILMMLFFSMYTVVWGEEAELKIVEGQQNNLVIKVSDGGEVNVIDNVGIHEVIGEWGGLYEQDTDIDIEIVPHYGYYIASITLNGEQKEDYELDSIYECMSNLIITNEVCMVEVTFGRYSNVIPAADGDTVKITKGKKYEYDGYYTNEYWIYADGYSFLGSCAEPIKDGPDGESFIAAKVSDPIFRYLMWCYQSDEFREEAFGIVEEEEQFILLHTTLGYYYCGELGFGETENSGKKWLDRADTVLNWIRQVFYGSDEERYVKARTAARQMYDTYIAWGGEDYQDIVWIQPKNVDLLIYKRSSEDFVSGERHLPGGIFELYAWDGSSYNQKVGVSVDQGDGTYVFTDIHYMAAVEGKFLIKEVAAPEGYDLPYYFYDDNDSVSYQKYGGREIRLDKSYLEWSCDSTKNYEDSSAGFTFYNSPQNKVFPYSIQIMKVNENETVLEGAEFTLFSDLACTQVITKAVTDENGILKMTGLICGNSYYLKETMPPKGYQLSEDTVVYEIKGEIPSVDEHWSFFVNGIKYEDESSDCTQNIYLSGSPLDKIVNIKIVNKIGILLPETGSGIALICFFIGVILMGSTLGFGIKAKIKNNWKIVKMK